MVAQDIMSNEGRIGRGIWEGHLRRVLRRGMTGKQHVSMMRVVGTIVCTELGRERTMVAPLMDAPCVCGGVWRAHVVWS